MISVRWTPNPPGAPGMKVHYFLKRPRHRITVPLAVFSSVVMAWSGWLMWNAGRRDSGTLLLTWGSSLAVLVLAVVTWRHGVRTEERLTREMGAALASRKERPR